MKKTKFSHPLSQKILLPKLVSHQRYQVQIRQSASMFYKSIIFSNPILHHGIRKGIKKYDTQQERNESLKSSYNNESVENKDDSWNFSSEDQF